MARDRGIALAPHEHRRNLTTRGVPLGHLVGQYFRVRRLCALRWTDECAYHERIEWCDPASLDTSIRLANEATPLEPPPEASLGDGLSG